LKVAQTFLEERIPGARLKLFDCFRPKGVQIYMRDRTFKEYAGEMQLDLMTMSEDDRAAVWRRVDALWARPSDDSSCPTPHSTGGAVDVTYVGDDGVEVDMGSSLDESSARILPAHYDGREDVPSKTFADRRELLRDVMESAGFTRLSHEWWHFSYGDQFWALIESLRTGENVAAIYGEVAV
jgi:D-alanyl-D-alanine dipeptidase